MLGGCDRMGTGTGCLQDKWPSMAVPRGICVGENSFISSSVLPTCHHFTLHLTSLTVLHGRSATPEFGMFLWGFSPAPGSAPTLIQMDILLSWASTPENVQVQRVRLHGRHGPLKL